MAFLASWIKGLVLAVIMATFLDLLLPNNTMRRYVRLVMGLIILVLILSPLLTLSQRDWSIDTLFVEVREVPTDELESLPHIEARADDLVDKQEQWVHETVQRRLEQGIKEGVEQQFAVAVEHISVALVEEGEQPERRQAAAIALIVQAHGEEAPEHQAAPDARSAWTRRSTSRTGGVPTKLTSTRWTASSLLMPDSLGSTRPRRHPWNC